MVALQHVRGGGQFVRGSKGACIPVRYGPSIGERVETPVVWRPVCPHTLLPRLACMHEQAEGGVL